MIVTTTPSIEGRKVREYKGIVFGEVVAGVNFLKDFTAGLRNIFGGRSQSYEEELITARENALSEMSQRALDMGANAVLSVNIDYEVLGSDGANMLLVTASGTAVVIE
ncbi:MAG: putative heavy metal-binding protein [Christensenellaceae bacterium]|nr:putative heavy metal-binding protein [Christensenellaceae bacterium]